MNAWTWISACRDRARFRMIRERIEPGRGDLRSTGIVNTGEQDGLHRGVGADCAITMSGAVSGNVGTSHRNRNVAVIRHDAGPDDGRKQHRRANGFGNDPAIQIHIHHNYASRFRMTTAETGHADWNSIEACTDAGTSSRSICSKPSFGKNRSAVVVSRNAVRVPRSFAMLSAASLKRCPSP